MFICLLGIVLSEKCVLILVICFDFFVIMMNCMIVIMRNIMLFIIMLLLIIRCLNVLIMWLVFVCSRISLYDVMFSVSWNSVVNSSSVGNDEKLIVDGM